MGYNLLKATFYLLKGDYTPRDPSIQIMPTPGLKVCNF